MGSTGNEHAAARGQEIERRFLLRGLPTLPAHATPIRIQQGYFLPDAVEADTGTPLIGRLRCATYQDGRSVHTHTVKQGRGLVREETERTIDQEMFERLWPHTAPLRLTKMRYAVGDGALTWEVDDFDDLDLVLAEVELDDADAPAPPPPWLAPFIEREVTDDPAYTSAAIARHLAAIRSAADRQ
jgi:adenylate cyclase